MGAAEKLKALEAPERGYLTSAGMLIDALPQIVAVVEAAERLEHARQVTLDRSETMDEHESLAAALSALDEKLGDVT